MNRLYLKLFVSFITISIFTACREQPYRLAETKAGQYVIDSTLMEDDSVNVYIDPFRKRLNEVLDEPLTYAPKTLDKNDGEYNSSLGNLMADIVLEKANALFLRREGKNVDIAVLNHGGIRNIISEGPVSERVAYEVMPFENTIEIVAMKGSSIREMVNFLIRSKRPHPIAGMQIVLNASDGLHSLKIGGIPFNEDRIYYVASNNYLIAGGDVMGFFKGGLQPFRTQYKVRNAMVDYFREHDTLKAAPDDRFIKLPK